MNDSAPTRDLSLAGPTRRLGGIRALGADAASDRLTTALVLLMAAVWCLEGLFEFAGLPHRAILIVDLAEVLLCVWLGVRLFVHHTVPRIPVLVVVYVCWVAAGLVTHAQPAAVVTALKSLLLLPALAVLIAASGTTERRARVFVATLLALATFEFLLTLWQSFRFSDPDSIVGSFGASANAVTAAVVLLAVCVGLGGYLVQAPYGILGLAGAAVLPLFSAWALVKIVPVLAPVVAVAVVVPALLLGQTSRRRAVVSIAAVTVSAGLVVGSYALFHPDSFTALVSTKYAENASVSQSSQGPPSVAASAPNGVGMRNFWNASVALVPVAGPRAAFRIGNLAAGDYTAELTKRGGSPRVKQGVSYVFSAFVVGARRSSPQKIATQIEWRGRRGELIGIVESQPVSWSVGVTRLQRLVVSGIAPAGVVTAVPKIAVSGGPVADSAIVAEGPQLARGTVESARAHVPYPAPSTQGALRTAITGPGPTASRPFPGRVTQWRMAEHAISGSPAAQLFGNGLGSATLADNLGVQPRDLSADAAAASYSDFGTLLVERGWTGIVIVALFAAALAAAACRIARTLPPRRWTTALTVAVPGAVSVMAAYGMIADQLRSRPAALTFWLVIALGLSPETFLGGRPWRRGPSLERKPPR